MGQVIHEEQPETPDGSIEYNEDIFGTKQVSRPKLIERVERKLDRLCENYEVPIERERFSIAFFKDLTPHIAAAAPYGCGEEAYWPEIPKWEVEKQPDGYLLMFSVKQWGEIRDELHDIVAHEVAHCCGWERHGVTYESDGNHERWCTRLDCENTLYSP